MISKRTGRISAVLFLLWGATMLWVLDTRVNFTQRSIKRKQCPCAALVSNKTSTDAKSSSNQSPKVKTRTVVKWLNYCKDGMNSLPNGTNSEDSANKGGVLSEKDGVRKPLDLQANQTKQQKDVATLYKQQELQQGQQQQNQPNQQPGEQQQQQQQQQQQDGQGAAQRIQQQRGVPEPVAPQAIVNPHPYVFTIDNSDACVKGAGSTGYVDVLCLVYTAPADSYMRSLIRKTWASAKEVKDKRIVTMFLLGQRNLEVQQLIELENNQYHDIIQENFTDSYYNLTIKTIMGLKWASHYCSNARFIVKMDIDMFVNVYNLLDRIEKVPAISYAEGNRKDITTPIRNKQSKWYTSKDVYAADSYPPYLNGPAYLMSADLAARIYKTSYTVRFLPWEDAFVGIIMSKLNVDPRYNGKYDTYLNYTNEEDTLTKIGGSITFHLGEDKDKNKDKITMVWNYVKKLNNVPVL